MADLTYEIAWWPAPEAVKKDINAYKPVVDVITKYTPHPYARSSTQFEVSELTMLKDVHRCQR